MEDWQTFGHNWWHTIQSVIGLHMGDKNPLSFVQIWKLVQKINRLSFYFWPQEIVKDTIRTMNYYFNWTNEYTGQTFNWPRVNLIVTEQGLRLKYEPVVQKFKTHGQILLDGCDLTLQLKHSWTCKSLSPWPNLPKAHVQALKHVTRDMICQVRVSAGNSDSDLALEVFSPIWPLSFSLFGIFMA